MLPQISMNIFLFFRVMPRMRLHSALEIFEDDLLLGSEEFISRCPKRIKGFVFFENMNLASPLCLAYVRQTKDAACDDPWG